MTPARDFPTFWPSSPPGATLSASPVVLPVVTILKFWEQAMWRIPAFVVVTFAVAACTRETSPDSTMSLLFAKGGGEPNAMVVNPGAHGEGVVATIQGGSTWSPTAVRCSSNLAPMKKRWSSGRVSQSAAVAEAQDR